MRTALGVCLIFTAVVLASRTSATAADQFDIISFETPSPNVEIVHIRQPNVKSAQTPYSQITFKGGDEIVVDASGCVQTGGSGDTWKRYVNPSGEESDKYYFGLIWIPGATGVMVPIQGVVGKTYYIPPGAPTTQLWLGYSDDNLSDNGYYDHDNGTENQCAGQDGGPASVTLTITHNATHQNPTTEVAPFDLFWDKVDPNWIPYQAIWGESINHKLNPTDHPSGLPGDAICAVPWLNPCTTQAPSIDTPPFQNAWFSCDHLGGPMNGHANWGPGTYEGQLEWESKSLAGLDDDYSLNLTTVDNAGGTTSSPQGYHIEFDSDETIDHFGSKWWTDLHTAVDDSDTNGFIAFHKKWAIVTGLIDLDCAHPCDGELHPVYALFVRTNDTPTYETWQFFARNWGNEGGCASDDHQLLLANNLYTVRLPWFPGATKVEVGTVDYATSSDAVALNDFVAYTGVGVDVPIQFPGPDSHGLIDGTIHLKWTVSSASPVVSPRPVMLSSSTATVSSIRTRPVRSALMLTLPFGGARDDVLPPMTASQLKVFRAHLPPVPRHPNKRRSKAGGPIRAISSTALLGMRSRPMVARGRVPLIRSVFDTAKAARDAARIKALFAAFGGTIPGTPARSGSGIGGATLNPPPH